MIEIVYREARPNADEGPFLTEERNLIQSLAGMLRAYFERVQARRGSPRSHAGGGGASASGAREFGQGRIPGHALSRTAVASERHALGGPRCCDSAKSAPSARLEIRDSGPQCATAGTIDRGPLDVSRIIAGKLRIEKRRIDLGAIVDTAVDAARPAARMKNVTLTAQIEPSLTWRPIRSDFSRWFRISSRMR